MKQEGGNLEVADIALKQQILTETWSPASPSSERHGDKNLRPLRKLQHHREPDEAFQEAFT